MSITSKGWIIFIAAMGIMLTLISDDISDLDSWNEVKTPGFVASMFAHMGAVIGAFVGGRLIPTNEVK